MERFPDRALPIADFLREGLLQAGAEWEETPGGILEVLLPGESGLRRATFEPEIAREEPGVELVGHSSPLVEWLAQRGLSRGRLSRAWARPPAIPPPPLGSAFELRAERLSRSEWTPRTWTTWIFAFWTRTQGEFRADTIELFAVDGASLRQVRRFREIFDRCVLEDVGPDPENDLPFDACYQAAREEALPHSLAIFRNAEILAEGEALKECSRIRSYYDGVISEMNEDMERLAPEDARRTAILSRIQATRADRDRSIADARERYRLRLEVEVIGALGIAYPREVATITLSNKAGSDRGSVQVAWDPMFEHFEPVFCPSCRRPTYSLHLRGRELSCGCR